jgi:outer membrane protein
MRMEYCHLTLTLCLSTRHLIGVTIVIFLGAVQAPCSRNLKPRSVEYHATLAFALRAKMLSALSDYSSKTSVRTLDLTESLRGSLFGPSTLITQETAMSYFAVEPQRCCYALVHFHSVILIRLLGYLALLFGMAVACPVGHAQQDKMPTAKEGSDSTPVANGYVTAETVSLSLHQAVQLGLKQNPRLLASRIEALESKQSTKIARSAFLPKASLGFEEQANRLNLATIFGQDTRPYSVGPYSNVQLGSNFDVPIIAASAWRSYQAQKQREAASQFDADNSQETIASIIVAQYLSLQRSKATERAVQSRIDLAEGLFRLANDELAQGTGTSTDALRANVELHVEKENLVAAQAQTEAYGFGLAQVLGLSQNQRVLATEELSAQEEEVPSEQQSIGDALQARPDLNLAEALQRAAVYDRKASTSERLPEFHFDGFWAQSGRSPGGALPIYTYQGEMRMPLFTGGRITAEIHRARLNESRTSQLVEDQRNVITEEVRTALTALQAARQELELSTQAVNLSTREVTESRDRFAAGVTNNIEVITAQTSLAQSTDSQIGAMYRLQQSKADLSRARGHIAAEYGK